MSTNLFFDSQPNLRNGWWIAMFFVILAALLFPLLMMARQDGVDLAIWKQAMTVLVASYLVQWLRRKPMAELTGKLDVCWAKRLLAGALLGSALMALPALFLWIAGYVRWQANVLEISVIGSGFLSCAAVAVAEEVLFRGVLFQRLIAGLGVWPAQLLIAGYFLLTHSGNPGMDGNARVLASINIFLASILFGLAYLRSKKLAMPLGMHMMANSVQGSVLGFGVSGNMEAGWLQPVFSDQSPTWLTGGTFGLEASLPGLMAVILAIALLLRQKTAR